MNVPKKALTTLALMAIALASAGNASAFPYAGTFGAGNSDVIPLSLASAGVVDFMSTGGYGDPTFSLFNASGTHMITNDDSIGLWSHLTQSLGAGNYSLVVGPCCTFYSGLTGVSSSGTDGFNSGSYYFGTGTLSSVLAAQASGGYGAGAPYSLTISDNLTVGAVPEPETYAMLLAGLGLMGFMARRRKQREAA